MIDFRAILACARLPLRAFGVRGHFAVLSIYALALAASLRLPALDASERFAIVERTSLSGGLFLAAVVLSFWGATAFAPEFEDRIGFFVFPKPARRASVFLGKALGLLLVLAIWTAGFLTLGGAALAAVRAGGEGDRAPGVARSVEHAESMVLRAPNDRPAQLFLSPGNEARFEGRKAQASTAWLTALRLVEHGHEHEGAGAGAVAEAPARVRLRWRGPEGADLGEAFLELALRPGDAAGEYEPVASMGVEIPKGASSASLEWAGFNEVLRIRAASLIGPSGEPIFGRLSVVLRGEGFAWLPDETTGAEARWTFARGGGQAESLSAAFAIAGFGTRGVIRAETDGRTGRPIALLEDREVRLREGAEAGAGEAAVRLASRGEQLLVERKSVFRVRTTGSYAWNYARAWGMTFAHAAILAGFGLLFGAAVRPGMAALLCSVPLVFSFVAGFVHGTPMGSHSQGSPDFIERFADAVQGVLGRAFEASASLDPGPFLSESMRIPAAAFFGALGLALSCLAAAMVAGSIAISRRRLD